MDDFEKAFDSEYANLTEAQLKQLSDQIKQDKVQEELMRKLYDDVTALYQRANLRAYSPTTNERYMFGQIINIIKNMADWF